MDKIKKTDKKYIWHTYKRYDLVLARGKGCYLYDYDGKKYLDFLGGIATCPIGYGDIELSNAIKKQAENIINASNLFYTKEQVMLAQKLALLSGLSKCFFSNSGTEAVEAAIKLARKYTGKHEIIAMEHSFHGRTMGSLAATWEKKIKTPFGPMLKKFVHIKFNDVEALKKAITKNTAAVILEPIQGEAGVLIPDAGYLRAVSKICKEKNILLIIDEVQTGLGRTGKFLAFQHENIKPDIVIMAKGLANGVPIGVTLAKKHVANSLSPGMHGSTFGGNSLSTKAALTVIEIIEKKKLIKNAEIMGEYFLNELRKIKSDKIKEVRGKGLMLAIELNVKGAPIVRKCIKKGLIINCANYYHLRFLPAFVISKNEIDRGIKIITEVLK
jgi:predicted acetylornithine/succinylornithine family transaminase